MSQQPLYPIKVTAQAGDWAEQRTGQQQGQGTWLTIHQKRRNKPA